MTNTMKDLRRAVQARLHETLDGKELDMMEGITPKIPHMLGITSLNAVHTHYSEDGTLLDPTSDFWQNYEEDVNTKSGCHRKIESAIRSLKKDGLMNVTYPYGVEADIIYCEVEPVDDKTSITDTLGTTIESSCPECGTDLNPSPLLDLYSGSAQLKVSVKCEACEFSASYGTTLHKL